MRFYSTQYRLSDPSVEGKRITFHSAIYASNYAAACQIALVRNIGEFVTGVIKKSNFDPCPLPSDLYRSRKLIDCLHTLTFYSWIGSACKVIDPVETLNDVGLIHEVMHEVHHPQFYDYREDIEARLVHLESLIPGLKSFRDIVDLELKIGEIEVEMIKVIEE